MMRDLSLSLLAGIVLALPATNHCEKKEATTMEAELRALDRHPELTVTIRSGTEHFRGGQITVTLRGDGSTTVEQLQAGQRTEYQARLPPARVAQVGTTLADHHFTASRKSKLPREPGDTPLILSLSRGETPIFQANLWHGDRYTVADLDAILVLYGNLMFEASGGKLGEAPALVGR